jgi:hypothetical protein
MWNGVELDDIKEKFNNDMEIIKNDKIEIMDLKKSINEIKRKITASTPN